MLQERKKKKQKEPLLIEKQINERFMDFVFNWDYKQYLLIGAYGSSKSYHVACKIIFKLLEEKRKALVVRQVYDTIKESCFDLFYEILDDMDMLAETTGRKKKGIDANKVIYKTSPMEFKFPNGSRIIFKGMDKPAKLKSINGVTIVWLEEASEIKYEGYKELLGRLRHPDLSLHFILSLNPVDKENWVYKHFFENEDKETGERNVILDDEVLYANKTVVKNNVYYHHSLPEDNAFLSDEYIQTLEELKEYDKDLYRVARLGRFGYNGRRVFPQFEVATSHKRVIDKVRNIPDEFKFIGMDFGFEESYNAIIKCAVDTNKKYLYIYAEYYKNNMTDDETLEDMKLMGLDKLNKPIKADAAEPKAIKYYRKSGIRMVPAKKFPGSRLAYTKKVKRFKKIICSPKCINAIRELRNLTYAKDKNGEFIYDEFNIDPHTLSAIWYALDTYDVADLKEEKRNTRKGEAA